MSSEEKKISVQRSDGEVEELTPDELERLNYERKIRDQQDAGKRVTPKHINIVAVVICVIGLVYALPRIIWLGDEEISNYVPLSERDSLDTLEVLPPLPREPNAFIQGTASFETAEEAAEPSIQLTQNSDSDQSISETSQEGPEITRQAFQEPAEPSADLNAQATEQEILSELTRTIEQWAEDWASQDVDAYLSHYAGIFKSERGQGLQDWKDYRYARVLKPEWIEIQLYEINTELTSDNTARATFEQIYSASNYADQSDKQLELILEEGDWKISREFSLQ